LDWQARNLGAQSRILPDGCIDLIFQNCPDGSRLFTSALIEQAATMVTEPGTWFAGVRFRPAMSRVVLDVDPQECRDREIQADCIEASFSGLEGQLADCQSPIEALHVLRTDVDRRISRHARRAAPLRVQNALDLPGPRVALKSARSRDRSA
jgi:hypothetical protein